MLFTFHQAGRWRENRASGLSLCGHLGLCRHPGIILLGLLFSASMIGHASDALADEGTRDPAAVAASVERLSSSLFGAGAKTDRVKPIQAQAVQTATAVSAAALSAEQKIPELQEASPLPAGLGKEALAPPSPVLSGPDLATPVTTANFSAAAASAPAVESRVSSDEVRDRVVKQEAPLTPGLDSAAEQRVIAERFERARLAANEGNFTKARKTWEILAQLGHADSEYALGRLYARGDGVKRSFSKASEYWKLAAAKNHGTALHSLGLLARNGDGQPKDKELALRYFQRARAAGFAAANDTINDLFKKE